jgi:hypothetical protein
MNTVSKSSFSFIAIKKGFPPWEAGHHHEGHEEHEGRNKVNRKEIFTAEALRV